MTVRCTLEELHVNGNPDDEVTNVRSSWVKVYITPYLTSRKKGYPTEERVSSKVKLANNKKAFAAIFEGEKKRL